MGAVELYCAPWWTNSKDSTCPYGDQYGDVTWPSHPTPLQYVSIAYGYTLHLAIGIQLLELLYKRSIKNLLSGLGMAILVFFNESVMKQIFHLPRPGQQMIPQADGTEIKPKDGTCAKTCGFPSSHAFLAAFLLFTTSFNYINEYTYLNLTPSTKVSLLYYVLPILGYALLLGPVPASRVVLHDHTLEQVSVGAAGGVVMSALWILAIQAVLYAFPSKLKYGTSFWNWLKCDLPGSIFGEREAVNEQENVPMEDLEQAVQPGLLPVEPDAPLRSTLV